jgi:hypothetical protein
MVSVAMVNGNGNGPWSLNFFHNFMVTNSTTIIRSNQQQQSARQWKQQSAKQRNRTAAELHGTMVNGNGSSPWLAIQRKMQSYRFL